MYKFAGDALIIVWTASGPFAGLPLQALCLKALKCGMELKVRPPVTNAVFCLDLGNVASGADIWPDTI